MADMSDVLNVLTAIENYLIDLPMKIILKADQIFIVNGLSDVSENLGIITAGEFRSGNRLEPGKLFSGMRMAYPPMTYSASEWNLVGVNADVLQFGVRASDGKLLAGGGAVILDASGITATAGLIAGWTINTDHLLSDGTPGIKILSTGTIETSDFVSGILGKGWRISEAGDAEFNNAVVRGELRTTVLSYQEVQAVSGTMGVFQSAGVLRATYEIPAAGDATITVKDPEYGHAALFAVDDILWIKDGTNSTWLKVKVVLDNTTYYTYGCSIESGDREIEYTAGQAIVNFGVGGEGFLLMEAIGTGAPYFSVRTHAGAPYTATTEHVRMGNLNGNWGYSSDIYGVGIGQYAAGKSNITIDSTGLLSIKLGTTERIGMTTAGVLAIKNSSGNAVFTFDASAGAEFTLPLTLATTGGIYQGTGTFASPTTGLKIWNDSGVGRIGGYNATTLQWYAGTDGKLYAGGGNVLIDIDGLTLNSLAVVPGGTFGDPGVIRWVSSTTPVGVISTAYNPGTGAASLEVQASGSTSGNLKLLATDNTNSTYLLVSSLGGITINKDLLLVGNYQSYKNSTAYTGYIFVPLTTPLTSTSWDGDSFSTTAKTIIDLSAVFGLPAGVKAVDVFVNMRDSASTTTYSYMYLGANDTANVGKVFSCDNGKNDGLVPASATIPCDANGDIFYQVVASGAGTMDITIQINGYYI